MSTNFYRWTVACLLFCGIAWSAAVARNHFIGKASIIDRFETVLLDLRTAVTGQRPPPEDIVIVAIDDPTIAFFGNCPLPRNRLAALIDRIKAAGARDLAVDILLLGESDIKEDKSLSNAINTLPTTGHISDTQNPANFVPVITNLLSAPPAVADASSFGLVNIVTDTSGTPSHIPLFFMNRNTILPSCSLRAVGLYQGKYPSITKTGLRVGDIEQKLDLGWHLALNYYGPGGSIHTISARTILEAEPSATLGRNSRHVVVGVTATAVGGRFNTPIDVTMPGVEVQATGIANLLNGSHLLRDADTRLLEAAVALTISLLGMLAVMTLSLASAAVLYIFLLFGWLAAITFFFGQSHWLDGAIPFAASLPPVVGLIITRQIADCYQARRHLKAQEALSRFQSPPMARRIVEDPTFLSEPIEQNAAILFADLSGFTRLSERLGPVNTRDFLKEFHTILVNVLINEHGVVLDFMGDGALMGFGMPEPKRSDPERAFRCAFRLESAISTWLQNSCLNSNECKIRVGAHFGRVVLSRLGHDTQQQIAATGDCVNVACRLLEIAKNHHASIVISEDLIDAANIATEEPVHDFRLKTVAIRGRSQALRVGIWNADESVGTLQSRSIRAKAAPARCDPSNGRCGFRCCRSRGRRRGCCGSASSDNGRKGPRSVGLGPP